MTPTLYVFALNMAVTARHTNLTRQSGEPVPDLPDLAGWIGVERLDTNRIELFYVSDLTGLGLPEYLAAAYDASAESLREAGPRLRALGGSVLLVPSEAISGPPQPRPEATEIARLPVAAADHRAQMQPAQMPGGAPEAMVSDAPLPETPKPMSKSIAFLSLVALILAAATLWSLS